MGWSLGHDNRWGKFGRDIGYGVPAPCDHPGCGAEIDRGLSYVCGTHPYGGEHGCGLHFCGDHLHFEERGDELPQLCERCAAGELPFEPKPDAREWVKHKLTDESWEQWRAENAEEVAHMRASLTPEQNTTRSPDELLVAQAKSRSDLNSMNTSNEERERLKRLAEEAAPGGRWALRVNPATILSLIAENEAQAARVKALEEAGRNLKFALEVTDACLRTWNEGRGGPADVEGVLSRASALLHQGEADHGR